MSCFFPLLSFLSHSHLFWSNSNCAKPSTVITTWLRANKGKRPATSTERQTEGKHKVAFPLWNRATDTLTRTDGLKWVFTGNYYHVLKWDSYSFGQNWISEKCHALFYLPTFHPFNPITRLLLSIYRSWDTLSSAWLSKNMLLTLWEMNSGILNHLQNKLEHHCWVLTLI